MNSTPSLFRWTVRTIARFDWRTSIVFALIWYSRVRLVPTVDIEKLLIAAGSKLIKQERYVSVYQIVGADGRKLNIRLHWR